MYSLVRERNGSASFIAAALLASLFLVGVTPAQTVRSPSDTVREFYRALHERRFREAFVLSIYQPAIDGLSAAEFEELRPDFEAMATSVPASIEITGEQTSGDTSTVFVKTKDTATGEDKVEPVKLFRAPGGAWIIGDQQDGKAIQQAGKDYFFQLRIDQHEAEMQSILQRILRAEIAYAAEHSGQFTDLKTLNAAGLVRADDDTIKSLGYNFHLTPGAGGRGFMAGAEPIVYGRTGRVSYYMDPTMIKSADVKGKPFVAIPAK